MTESSFRLTFSSTNLRLRVAIPFALSGRPLPRPFRFVLNRKRGRVPLTRVCYMPQTLRAVQSYLYVLPEFYRIRIRACTRARRRWKR
jgi:hypothetical protein